MGGGGLLVGGLRKQNLDFAILKFGGFVGFVLIAHRRKLGVLIERVLPLGSKKSDRP